jgi:GAF domain-containing protein
VDNGGSWRREVGQPENGQWLLEAFVTLSDILVGEFDVREFFTLLIDQIVEFLDSAEAGIIFAMPNDQLRVMASSSKRTRAVELLELRIDQGPGMECYRSSTPTINYRIDRTDRRWPQFCQRALEEGFSMVHVLPIGLRSETIGVIEVLDPVPVELTSEKVTALQKIADLATIALIQDQLVQHNVDFSKQLQQALDSRIVIEQAKGFLAARLDLTPDIAFRFLRDYSLAANCEIGEAAEGVVGGRITEQFMLRTATGTLEE